MKTRHLVVVLLIVIGGVLYFRNNHDVKLQADAFLNVAKTWQGYKHHFIMDDGRVFRPKNNDVVSEGQAYAMLRAVWMNDKKTFDDVYRFTEQNMSRKNRFDDHLISWKWAEGQVTDAMPAADADIDYALALIFAQSTWTDEAPVEIPDYALKAQDILSDILEQLTVRLDDERLYLLPWIIQKKETRETFPINPSYYSPAHFRIFYQFTKDERWLELVDTTYYVLDALSHNLDDETGVGLISDWCKVNRKGVFTKLNGKNSGFGWEAVRVPIRVGLDRLWFNEPRAKEILDRLAGFVQGEYEKHNAVYSEYAYDGNTNNAFENPAFYAAYYMATMETDEKLARKLLLKNHQYLMFIDNHWVYSGHREYYVNSLAWFADGKNAHVIQNVYVTE